nr:hypothetical protein [Motilibacter deserti]
MHTDTGYGHRAYYPHRGTYRPTCHSLRVVLDGSTGQGRRALTLVPD